jgi:hypothetical protein
VALISDTKGFGAFNCTTNPYKNAAAITTGFRNVSLNGLHWGDEDVPANIHWDHLTDIHSPFSSTNFWDSDMNGTADSKTTCLTCHNPHGAAHTGNTDPTIRMTRQSLDIHWGSDATGTYGSHGADASFSCYSACHFIPNNKYYKTAP